MLRMKFENEMRLIFKDDTIKEFLELNVLPHSVKLEKLVQDCENQLKVKEKI